VGRPLFPLPACQWNFVLVFFIVGQASHDSTLFPTAIFIVDNQWTPRAKGFMDFLFWEGPSSAGRFSAAFLVIRGSRTSTPAGQSPVGTSKTYTVARSWPQILQTSDQKLWLCSSNYKHQN
jgi:hypothetical protein